MLALATIISAANGQETSAPSEQSTTQGVGNEPGAVGQTTSGFSERDSNQVNTPSATHSVALSTDQIIRLLQQTPDLIVELKSQVADRLQEQGTEINADDISDQMLYDQIASSASLRTSITTFLRARGYVTDEDLQVSRSVVSAEGADSATFTQRTQPQVTNSDAARLAADGALYSGQPLTDGNNLPLSVTRPTISTRSDRASEERQRSSEQVNTSTDAPKVLRQPTPYNLQAMRDLYTQIPDQNASLKRFGSDVFENHNLPAAMLGATDRGNPLDVALGPDYVVGPGDTLTINLWGSITQSFTRTIDREGRVFLPEAGSLQVAGLPLERAQGQIEADLKQQFRNAQVSITVSRLHSVRVYVVGDVQRPGGYDISALATPVSALYAAGGPTAAGSLRMLRHYRGQQLVEEIDLYDFLLHGLRSGSTRFESGDTVLVPTAGPQVAVSGAIKRPAIYELKAGKTTLDTVISDAGGFTPAASLSHITVERIDANHQRETVTLNLAGNQGLGSDHAAVSEFQVQDGDRIRIQPVLPYSQRAIYLSGHVVRPGRLPYTDGMRLSDVLHSYQDLLPEPAAHGEIVRLIAPDLHAETLDFNVPDVLIGNANVGLQPFDTIRIFGRYEADAPKVTIRGEVLRPGAYPLSKGMTAAQLVRMAGGFKRDALQENADLTSYEIVDGDRITESLSTVHIGAAVAGTDATADVGLKPGDLLTIYQVTGWNDIGQSITIEGQVKYPGSYGFQEGERLSSVLRRAGGFLPAAYPTGAVLVREQVRELEQKSRDELIRQIETNSAAARLSPNIGTGDQAATMQLIKAQQEQALTDLKSHPPVGRMVIRITADIDSWANTPADIELRRGDVLTIPKRPGFVLVTGQVYNATALTFTPCKAASWYLAHAGGTNSTANRKEIFIIRANGSVVGRHSGGIFDSDVLSTKLDPGDVVVVPQKIIGSSLVWRNLLTTAQLASSIAITAAVATL
ncbi:MAG TPA: SLBB domain-containing protein [Pseudacidobacterium sp.]|jgi:protein involved in polysaccharide export with SLBB domain|nr:SLBB domain-containing protein [Pseudacidobacterium sp.]